ncbi:hypothetical protein JOB18_009559 [Solea senegalensis]|uniref:Uncharacterized protein n=1 Tax=Solea senegalensis TaxID=28829 RepID=A0AAV6PHU1_SOLSE|nr:hypothetical protein JOB18_009559 [Solea senegalensis]
MRRRRTPRSRPSMRHSSSDRTSLLTWISDCNDAKASVLTWISDWNDANVSVLTWISDCNGAKSLSQRNKSVNNPETQTPAEKNVKFEERRESRRARRNECVCEVRVRRRGEGEEGVKEDSERQRTEKRGNKEREI